MFWVVGLLVRRVIGDLVNWILECMSSTGRAMEGLELESDL